MGKNRYSSSSKRWLKEHFSDQYVKRVKRMGVRSRAWFKLDQINSIDFLFYSGMSVVDLGASPGGWSEYVKKK